MATNYKASDELAAAVRQFEGLRLRAYRDTAGVLTIGYGHTTGVKATDRITERQADEYLSFDLWVAGRYVNSLGVAKTQGQYDALTDFVFNLGWRSLRSSTLLRKIEAGAKTEDIQKEFRRWVYAGKKKLAGLVKRREWEAQRWAS